MVQNKYNIHQNVLHNKNKRYLKILKKSNAYYVAHRSLMTAQQPFEKQQNYLHRQKHDTPIPRMSMTAVPITAIMYMIGGSGGTGKCLHNYVAKHAVSNNIHI
jgi:hypothetical protein